MRSRLSATSLNVFALATLVAWDKKPPEAPAQKAEAPASAPPTTASAPPAAASAQPVAAAAPEAAPQPNPERKAYFGETHIAGQAAVAVIARALSRVAAIARDSSASPHQSASAIPEKLMYSANWRPTGAAGSG